MSSTVIPRVAPIRTPQTRVQSFARPTKSCSLIILSFPPFSEGPQWADLLLAHPNQCEERNSGTEDYFQWGYTYRLFGNVKDINCSIQR